MVSACEIPLMPTIMILWVRTAQPCWVVWLEHVVFFHSVSSSILWGSIVAICKFNYLDLMLGRREWGLSVGVMPSTHKVFGCKQSRHMHI